MKTKTLFLICLLSGIGLTQLSAQNGKNGTGTDIYEFVVPWDVTIPVICNGELIDLIIAPAGLTIKVLDHFKNGVLIKEFSVVNNAVFASNSTEEIFIMNGSLEKFEPVDFNPDEPLVGFDYLQFNVKGNMGNHYNIHMVTDLSNMEIVEVRANCH